MNFVVENYSNSTHTQPMYLAHNLKELKHESFLFNRGTISLFDMFDRSKCDVFITHSSKIGADFFSYHTTRPVKLLLNIQNTTQDLIDDLEQYILSVGVNAAFFTSCHYSRLPKTKKIKVSNLAPAADLNLLSQNAVQSYNIPFGIFISDNKLQIPESPDCDYLSGAYHTLCNTDDKVGDISFPEMSLSSLYGNYDTLIFRYCGEYLEQAFLDAIVRGKKVYYHIDNKEEKERMAECVNSLLKPTHSLDYTSSDRMTDFSQLKSYIVKNHSGKNRAENIVSLVEGMK